MSSNLLDLVSVNDFYNGLPRYFWHIASIFEEARSYAHVSDFARLSLQALESSPKKGEDYMSFRSDILSRLFSAALKTCQFDEAYSALTQYSNETLQSNGLTSLITTILTASGPGTAGLQKLLRYPFSLSDRLFSQVDSILVELATRQRSSSSFLGETAASTSTGTPDYSRILQAYRIARNNFRGAAEVAYQTVCRIRDARESPSTRYEEDSVIDVDEEDDLESRRLRNELLSLINLLACMEESEAYILVDRRPDIQTKTSTFRRQSVPDKERDGAGPNLSTSAGPDSRINLESKYTKRVVITLEDLRREYQAELDRAAKLQRGDWEYGIVDEVEYGDVEMGDDGPVPREEDAVMR